MIRHASVYDRSQDYGEQTLRVLIMRKWPRGIRRDAIDEWLKDAAPSNELLQAYNKDALPWDAFAERYRSEIVSERPHVLDRWKQLEREHGTITLLCHERIPPHEHCHRTVLADLLARAR
jgi:uncharacterized protein YeaO (DUF488 family)